MTQHKGRPVDTTPPPGELRWQVGEDGNTVVLTFEFHDNYEAIELAETIAAGLREGHLEIEVENVSTAA